MSFFEELKRRNVIRVGIAYSVTAWLLLQLADVILGNIAAPAWVFQVIMLVLGIGFPIVMIFAWAFEMTPEGIKREADVDRDESITPTTGKKLDRVIIAVMALVITFLLVDRFVIQSDSNAVPVAAEPQTAALDTEAQVPAKDDTPSVAVLPFVNMSGNAENEYFSDGLTETLLHMLAQLPELKVAARTSSFAFKGQNANVSEIAESLGVAHILEGSVQRQGDRVRVTAQLIRADDGFHVWSQNYDRILEDIFAIQDEIATDVMGALDSSLLAGRQITSLATHDINAYDLYLKALEQQAVFSYASLGEAESLLKQSLAQDPEFIDARLSLARNHLMAFGTGLSNHQQLMERLSPLLEQIEQVQPGNPTARAFKLIAMLDASTKEAQDQRPAVVDELASLLANIPTESYVRALTATWMSNFLGQHERALELINGGLLVDPLNAFLNSRKGIVLIKLERYEEARVAQLRAIELEPGYASAYSRMAGISSKMGDFPAMLEWMRKSIEVDPQDHELASQLALDLYSIGLPEEGDQWARRVSALVPDSDFDRKTRLSGHIAHNRMADAEQLARSMIQDQVSARKGAFWDAVFEYHEMSSRQRRAQEALEFLEQVRPETTNFDILPTDQAGVAMQWVSAMLIHELHGGEQSWPVWQKFVANLEATGARWYENEVMFRLMTPLFSGDLEETIRIALEESLSQPISDWARLTEYYRIPLFDPITSDPRVSARMSERDRELQQIRRQVQDMLQGEEWQ